MKLVIWAIFALLPLLATAFTYNNQGSDWTGLCVTGSNQSPIDIDTVKGTCDNSMVFDITFPNTNSVITLTDTAFQIQGTNTEIKLYATDINGLLTGYTSTYMTFHAPSEHHIEGNAYDLEMQIQFAINTEFAAKGLTSYVNAIVSILFSVDDTSSANAWLTALNIPTTTLTAATRTINMFTSLGSTLPTTIPYYTYQGSFTDPSSTIPCAETVNWYVLDSIQTMQSSQLTAFTSRYSKNSTFAGGNGNNRAIQDLNDRTVKKGGIECEEQFVYFFSFFILYIFINYFIFKLL